MWEYSVDGAIAAKFVISENLKMKIFIICPVRNMTETENTTILNYIKRLEDNGNIVHYPPRNTNQNDECGIRICLDNSNAIKESDEVHVYWNKDSKGSLFDLGMAFSMGKTIRLINSKDIIKTSYKSFENVLLYLHGKN